MIRKDPDRSHGDNWVGGHGRPASSNVADRPAVGCCREQQLGNGVARLPQRLEERDLERDGTMVLRPPKARPPKSLDVDMPNRLVIVGLLLPNDHRLILAAHGVPRLGQC
jgi:hypothetical protein